jgi:hypothetical protein
MMISRRGMLLGAGGCCALLTLPISPTVRGAQSRRLAAGVGEVWGLTYWSRDSLPAFKRARPRSALQTDWRPFA